MDSEELHQMLNLGVNLLENLVSTTIPILHARSGEQCSKSNVDFTASTDSLCSFVGYLERRLATQARRYYMCVSSWSLLKQAHYHNQYRKGKSKII